MRWYLIAAVFIAVLACPLMADFGDCEFNTDDLPTSILDYDETELTISNSIHTKLPPGTTIELGDAIIIQPVNENVRVTINEEKIENEYIGSPYSPPVCFYNAETGKMIFETFKIVSISFEYSEDFGLKIPETIKDVSFLDTITLPNVNYDGINVKEWFVTKGDEKYSYSPGEVKIDRNFMNLFTDHSTTLTMCCVLNCVEYTISLNAYGGSIDNELWKIDTSGNYICIFTRLSDNFILPNVEYSWQYKFMGWVDENKNGYSEVNTKTFNDLMLYADKKVREYNILFYSDSNLGTFIDSKTLTAEHFETPDKPNEYFDGWYYENQGNECEFKKGVALQDGMKIYAKYIPTYTINFYKTYEDCQNPESMLETKTFTDDESTFVLPVNSDEYFINWYYMDSNSTESVFEKGIDLQTEMNVYAKYKTVYDIFFYERTDATPIHKKLTDDHFEVPEVSNEKFLGWYYKDQNNTDAEFKEGVALQNNMEVYAKYEEDPVTAGNNTSDQGSKDTSLYALLTENGIKISDNEVVESVVASVIFVILALSVFLFVFRRH